MCCKLLKQNYYVVQIVKLSKNTVEINNILLQGKNKLHVLRRKNTNFSSAFQICAFLFNILFISKVVVFADFIINIIYNLYCTSLLTFIPFF